MKKYTDESSPGTRRVVGWLSAASATVLAAFGCCGSTTSASGANTPSGAGRCELIAKSIEAAGFDDKAKVNCEGNYANIASDTYPDHPMMDGIKGTNDQVPVPAPGYVSPIALNPVLAATPTSIDAALGVAVNGVPIYDYSSQGDITKYDPALDTTLNGELDLCNGHSGRGDDYHYHAEPTCMVQAMKNKGPSAILGWGFDGYPLYGATKPDGSAIADGELDPCNAMPDPDFGYRYHTSAAPPYIMQCLIGEVDLAKAPRVAPLSKQGGGGKPAGEKPRGGVTNLKLAEDTKGTRTMTYDHQGTTYSIQYSPSGTDHCWNFEERSFTTGGKTETSVYCRDARQAVGQAPRQGPQRGPGPGPKPPPPTSTP